jgi:2-succinyl-5-enolpyruvyl-6-hydroxy-3-cyclohexene-1-carboxylate synthase
MPAENAGRAFSLVLVDELVRQGMRHAVVAPGSRSTPIALALLENPSVTVHVRVDERSAAYLALGIAKAGGTVVPVLCTSGTAVSYFHGAVMEADLSCVPLLVLTADRPPELHGIGANQTVAQQGMYGDAVRWAPMVQTPESSPDSVAIWRWLAREAASRALGDRTLDNRAAVGAGPVHLNLPLREPLTPTDDGIGFPYDLGLGQRQSGGYSYAYLWRTKVLSQRVAAASRGVIVAGGWAAGEVDEVLAFADRAGWPVIAEPHSNARRGSLALRSTDALLRDDAFLAAHQPDLVIVVGRVGLSRALLTWLGSVPHVVLSPDNKHWDVTSNALAVVSGPPDLLASMEPRRADAAWAAEWLAASVAVSEAYDEILDASPTLTEPRVARDVASLIPDDAALIVSSSMPIRDLDLVMRPRSGPLLYANRGVSGIDGFVSTAQGVAIGGDHAGPTVALCGDLSLLHDINGLMPSGGPRPDVTYVVINNDGGGIFSLLPQGSAVDPDAFERLFGTPHGLSIERVAAAYDVPHTLVSTAAELAEALSSYGGIQIIEVRTDRHENAALHAKLRAITPRTA